MDEEMLDPFSRDFARVLFAAYPEWRPLAQAVPRPEGGPGALEVTVPAPAGSDLAAPLAVSTEGGEVTVYLGSCHVHCAWSPDEQPGSLQDPLRWIADILEERLVAVLVFNGERPSWGGLLSQAEASLEVDRAQPSGRVRVRSWRGRYDRDEPSALPDPILPELREDAAPPGVAAVYARLRDCTGGPGVGLVWRHAAALPGGLEWLWAQARPAVESGAAYGACGRLAPVVDAAVSAVPLPDGAARRGGGLAEAGEAAAALVRSRFRADLIDLVLMTAIKLRRDGVPAATAALPVRSRPAAAPVAAPPPLPRLSQLPLDSARRVRRLADALGPGTADAVPDLFLHLASWPRLLAALPERLAPLLEPAALAEVRDVVIGAAQAEALSLVPALGPAAPAPVACRAALHDALYVFTRRVLPGVAPFGSAVRVLLEGAAGTG